MRSSSLVLRATRHRRHLGCAVLAGVTACSFPELPVLVDAGSSPSDASVDAAPVACSATTCTDGVLHVCGLDGVVERDDVCAQGCFSDQRCNWIAPSNALGDLLDDADTQPAVVLPAGTTIDTDSGAIRVDDQVASVATATIRQAGGAELRVFLARSWSIDAVKVRGSLPLALVASGDVVFTGVLDVSADSTAPGPGATSCQNTGEGSGQTSGQWFYATMQYPGNGPWIWETNGAGGGGHGSAGGRGGDQTRSGVNLAGAMGGIANGVATLVPLRGGCRGGGGTQSGGLSGYGGGGGGAVQIVSGGGAIRVAAAAGINAGGGGGRGADPGVAAQSTTQYGAGGGGSGGSILLEAGSIRLAPQSFLLTAGGGGGGSGPCEQRNGLDAPSDAGTPLGGSCPVVTGLGQPSAGGAGATSTTPQNGTNNDVFAAGAGGGGLGRIRLNSANSLVEGQAGAVIIGVVTNGATM